MSNGYNFRNHGGSLQPPAMSSSPVLDIQLDQDVGGVLTATVSRDTVLTTATAINANSSVRSRSRSPHPAGNPLQPSVYHAYGDGTPEDRNAEDDDDHGERNPLVDTQSFERAPLNRSSTDLSSSDVGFEMTREDSMGGRFRSRLSAKWDQYKGLFMIVLSMFFGAAMGAVARLMQTGSNPMHTMQILFARMSITLVLSLAYMKWQRTPNSPFGVPGIRKLLVARGMGGFFGVYGLYYSVRYLPLGEATVITFLAPMVTNGVCSVLLKEPFTRREQVAAVISMVGVVFIARPTSFFSSNSSSADNFAGQGSGSVGNSTVAATGGGAAAEIPEASPIQRLIAVLVALVGVCGAACAYTTIRWIGRRAHPLISVTYFSAWCTVVSTVSLSAVPGVSFRFPVDAREWLLLLSLGTFGMIMQFLLTAGLARQRGSAATNMTYTQMVFVLAIDYFVWGTVLTWPSWVGCALILGSQIWGVMAREGGAAKKQAGGSGRVSSEQDSCRQRRSGDRSSRDEESGLVAVAGQHDDDEDEGDGENAVVEDNHNRRESRPGMSQIASSSLPLQQHR